MPVNIVADGSNGFYSFFVTSPAPGVPPVAGIYTLVVTPPSGTSVSTTCLPQAGALDPTPLAPGPVSLGANENALNPGFLTDNSCAGNPFYLEFDLAAGDPDIFNNNIPIVCPVVPVELSSFEAVAAVGVVELRWTTQTEIENLGFDILRSNKKNGEYVKVNEKLIAGAGNSSKQHEYEFVDEDVKSGEIYWYKLRDIDFAGNTTLSDPIWVKVKASPKKYTLRQNYPNPFNPTTTIAFDLKEAGKVKLVVYNISGQKVRTLVADHKAAGRHTITWDAKDDAGQNLPSGVYLYKLEAADFTLTRSMVFMK